MKKFFAIIAILAASPLVSSAADGAKHSGLDQYGLGAISVITEAEATAVRGTGGSAATHGSSFISGMLIDQQTKSYIFGVDTNAGMSTLEQAGLITGPVDPFHVQASNLLLGLEIENVFRGSLLGGAGGTATALFR